MAKKTVEILDTERYPVNKLDSWYSRQVRAIAEKFCSLEYKSEDEMLQTLQATLAKVNPKVRKYYKHPVPAIMHHIALSEKSPLRIKEKNMNFRIVNSQQGKISGIIAITRKVKNVIRWAYQGKISIG